MVFAVGNEQANEYHGRPFMYQEKKAFEKGPILRREVKGRRWDAKERRRRLCGGQEELMQ